MLTELELAAIALICELESNIRLGVPMTTALINAADNFRKVEMRTKGTYTLNLNNMYKQNQQIEKETNVIKFKKLVLVKDDSK